MVPRLTDGMLVPARGDESRAGPKRVIDRPNSYLIATTDLRWLPGAPRRGGELLQL